MSDVEIFGGFMNYHREYIEAHADIMDIAAPVLYQSTGDKGKINDYKYGVEHQIAFDNLKYAKTISHVLGYSNGDAAFI